MNKLLKNRLFFIALVTLLSLILSACGNGTGSGSADSAEDFPQNDINGIIQWGEGGATDIISRTLASVAEDEIGTSLVMENRTGASGAIATQYVYDQAADGYNLLFGAENPNLYQVLDISERDYMNDFVPVSIIGQSYAGIVVNADSEFDTLEDLVAYAEESSEDLLMGTSGEGGLPHVASAMLKNELGIEFNQIPYDGDGPLAVALLGDEIDVTVLAVSAAQEYVDSGDFKMLAVLNDSSLDSIPDVPPITDIYPEFEVYLPWGPFQGIFAHKDTPEEIVQKLSDGFEEAQNDEEFINQLTDLGVDPLNLHGEEASEFVEANQSTSAWMLYEAGETSISPEELGIPKVGE
ncbi:Bug family tripartite tricarboxylate transporter substrate binding protein [Oceanobacillus jeddahense]|uniref:Tripartite tricarboxylate transporter substrate binding protein n=1 Tax=Oceanobacillus jeddahense TaxID=1462527 RepID=A0ABY5JT10_9BACI|nr:tripartite tricarboxylate transporter substrate binding protein [Oceanobacillus jeddahense]UUI02920.1 tripartite tricarboxylate transporter substrate binding protein [Oceanobacillus jeddahense]